MVLRLPADCTRLILSFISIRIRTAKRIDALGPSPFGLFHNDTTRALTFVNYNIDFRCIINLTLHQATVLSYILEYSHYLSLTGLMLTRQFLIPICANRRIIELHIRDEPLCNFAAITSSSSKLKILETDLQVSGIYRSFKSLKLMQSIPCDFSCAQIINLTVKSRYSTDWGRIRDLLVATGDSLVTLTIVTDANACLPIAQVLPSNSLRSLQSLTIDLGFCTYEKLTCDDIQAVSSAIVFRDKLTSLSLMSYDVNESVMNMISTLFPNLSSLMFATQGEQSLAKLPHKLKTIVMRAPTFTQRAVQHLEDKISEVEHYEISSTYTTNMVDDMIDYFDSITVSDEDLAHMFDQSKLTTIQSFKMINFGGPLLVNKLIQACIHLQTLVVVGSNIFGDKSICKITNSAAMQHNLRSLHIQQCSLASQHSLFSEILLKLTELREISYVQNCRHSKYSGSVPSIPPFLSNINITVNGNTEVILPQLIKSGMNSIRRLVYVNQDLSVSKDETHWDQCKRNIELMLEGCSLEELSIIGIPVFDSLDTS